MTQSLRNASAALLCNGFQVSETYQLLDEFPAPCVMCEVSFLLVWRLIVGKMGICLVKDKDLLLQPITFTLMCDV